MPNPRLYFKILMPVKNGKATTEEPELAAGALDRSDAGRIKRCRKGDESAWNELVDRYQRLVFAVPKRAGLSDDQCSDIFQDVFLTLFQKIDEIEQPDRIRSWVVTTAKFKTWAVVRGGKGFYSPGTEEEMEQEMASLRDAAPLADQVLVELEEQHLVRTAMAGLDGRCRKILSMLYLRDSAASYSQVAEAIGVGETSISPLRSRCLKKLAKLLE